VATGVGWSDDASQGNYALRCDFDFTRSDAKWPHASYCRKVDVTQDWTPFVTLMLDVKSGVDPNFQVKVTISLKTDDDCWNELGDFHPVGPQWETLGFELDQPTWKVCPRYIDYNEDLKNKDDVRELCVVVVADGGKPTDSIRVDYVRLVGE
jgi:hypothetical protein